jgi:pyruvate dehydrogenase E2 component (dihydrolipoamide acetyltransferase)
MAWKVGMPNLGHTMESGTVSEWLMAPGDAVAAGDTIGLVETDKATFDIESPGDGILLAVYVEAGVEVPVGTAIAVVGAPRRRGRRRPCPAASPGAPRAARLCREARSHAAAGSLHGVSGCETTGRGSGH